VNTKSQFYIGLEQQQLNHEKQMLLWSVVCKEVELKVSDHAFRQTSRHEAEAGLWGTADVLHSK